MTPSPAPEEAIRECPWCGGIGLMDFYGGYPSPFAVSCQKRECSAIGPECETQQAAIAAWNRRAGDEREAWQPIETAPRDGERFVFWNGWIVGVGRYLGSATPIFAADSFAGQTAVNPTHWRPLPAPPRAALAGQTEGERNGG